MQGQYIDRLNRALIKAKNDPYDWILIMGGTNDLAWGRQPENIYEDLSKCTFVVRWDFGGIVHAGVFLGEFVNGEVEKVWNMALDSGASVLGLSIPEAAATIGSIVQRRSAVNAMIADHQQDRW